MLFICKWKKLTSLPAPPPHYFLYSLHCPHVEDIQVRFYEESSDGTLEWEAYGDFQPSDVHKQVAIAFKTPRYKTLEVSWRDFILLVHSFNETAESNFLLYALKWLKLWFQETQQ